MTMMTIQAVCVVVRFYPSGSPGPLAPVERMCEREQPDQHHNNTLTQQQDLKFMTPF